MTLISHSQDITLEQMQDGGVTVDMRLGGTKQENAWSPFSNRKWQKNGWVRCGTKEKIGGHSSPLD